MNYIIIGGGIAAVSCTQQLYNILASSVHHELQYNITILTQSNVLTYIKHYTQLTQYLSTYDVNEITSQQLTDDYVQNNTGRNHVHISINVCTVTRIDTHNETVYALTHSTHNNNNDLAQQQYKYDKLCICSGASPDNIFHKYTSPGISKFIHTIRDTASITNVLRRVEHSSEICIVGNGGIALELIYLLLQHQLYNDKNSTNNSIRVIWCIRAGHIGVPFFTASSAKFMIERLMKLLNDTPIIHNTNDTNDMPNTPQHAAATQALYAESSISGAGAGPNWLYEFTNKQRSYGHAQLYDESKQQYDDTSNDTIQLNTNCQLIIESNNEVIDLNEASHNTLRVQLHKNKSYNVDILISATGVHSNTQFVPDTINKSISDDIIVTPHMCSNISNIYSAGDCVDCSGWELTGNYSHWYHVKLWSHAFHMGIIAAKSMCDDISEYSTTFMLFTHLTTFFGLKVVLLGQYNILEHTDNHDQYYEYTKCDIEHSLYINVVLCSRRHNIIGCTLIGNNDLEEIYENVLISETDMSQFGDFVNNDVDLEAYFD